MGTGKTILGLNLVDILNRPREDNEVLENEVISRLVKSRKLISLQSGMVSNIIARARSRLENETIVTRALREYISLRYNDNETLANQVVDEMKCAETIVIDVSTLDSTESCIEYAIAKAIASQFNLSEYTVQLDALCAFLIKTRLNNRPIFIVLDEIGSLGLQRFSKWTRPNNNAGDAAGDNLSLLNNGMQILSSALQLILSGEKRFVYCTGRTAVISLQSLSGATSPLHPFPILLHPLSKTDVCETNILTLSKGLRLISAEFRPVRTLLII